MRRADILALTDDDLAALATRGKVKEARRELEDGRVSGTFTEEGGAVTVAWSDGLTSAVAAGTPLAMGRCSCNAVGACKHLVRLALAYQRQATAAGPSAPWDPGAIDDAELGARLRTALLTRARQLDDAGTLAEVVRGPRPLVRFHVPGCTVRFLLPGDVRYTTCDCARPAPCEHVPLAVWAFRRLAADRRAGVVTGGAPAPAVDPGLLDLADTALREFVEQGTSGAGRGSIDRLLWLHGRLETADLVWPAEILGDLIRQQESYAAHDARFDPARVAELLGELVVRLDAVRANRDDLPQRLIRGSNADRPVGVERSLFWGLGCAVHTARRSAEVVAYLYDCKTACVVVLSREVPEEDDAAGKGGRSFARLGQRVAVKGTSFAALGAGVLQMESGRRSARHELMPGRSGVGVMTQDRLAWEEIAPPVLVEEFPELEERLGSLPPSALRPRRLAEDVHVLRVAGVEAARFDVVTHAVQAVLLDRGGGRALLEHPYTSRGRPGAEALLRRLTAGPGRLLFVAGRVRRAGGGLRVAPLGLVWQEGDRRDLLQPWIDPGPAEAAPTGSAVAAEAADPVGGYLQRLQEALGELTALGLARADAGAARAWGELARQGEAVGFGGLAARVGAVAGGLEGRAHTLRWDPAPVAQAALELAGLLRLAGDVG